MGVEPRQAPASIRIAMAEKPIEGCGDGDFGLPRAAQRAHHVATLKAAAEAAAGAAAAHLIAETAAGVETSAAVAPRSGTVGLHDEAPTAHAVGTGRIALPTPFEFGLGRRGVGLGHADLLGMDQRRRVQLALCKRRWVGYFNRAGRMVEYHVRFRRRELRRFERRL